jgi:hypothetical protein|tara:strand:+ start:38 stop:484 length:447 start_codon:yes stop_codon:yes gene_type:complete
MVNRLLLKFPWIVYIIYVMKIKKDMKLKVRKVGEWFCRGDRGWEESSEEIDLNKIEKFYENGDEDGDCERGIDLNRIEEDIVFGDYGFCEEGFDKCMDRVNLLKEGKCVFIEREEEDLCIGVEDGSNYGNNVELYWLEMRKKLLKGER